jgi:acyl-CoA reductase-like NAD-dependent aldehyde dehydrogenase
MTTWEYDLYIDGKATPSDGDGRITVLDPATEEVIGSVPDATVSDTRRAIAAARRAFDEGRPRFLRADDGALGH